MARHKDAVWTLDDPVKSWNEVHAALLMDIRDELKRIGNVLNCSNCLAIPFKLDRIARNTTKPKRRKTKQTAS